MRRFKESFRNTHRI